MFDFLKMLGFPRGRRKMTRRDFTKNICILVTEMVEVGDQPIFDYILRSTEEQARLYEKNLSKCDGIDKVSAHQKATATDIYLCHYNESGRIKVDFVWNIDKSKKWHKRWEELGGKPMLSWDPGHFE